MEETMPGAKRTTLTLFACLIVGCAAAFGDVVGSLLLGQTGVPSMDLTALIERVGTIGALVWMILYFQKRLAERDKAFEARDRELIAHLQANTSAMRDVERTLAELRRDVKKA